MAIALIEQEHYVTVFIAGATSSAALSSDTTLSGILSGISWVTTKPDDANTGDTGTGTHTGTDTGTHTGTDTGTHTGTDTGTHTGTDTGTHTGT